MFIFAKNWRQIVITAGALVACLILLALGAKSLYLGEYWIALSILSVWLVVAIYRGVKLGYQIGRYLFGVAALICAVGAINNPIAYADSVAQGWSDSMFELQALEEAVVGMAMYFCLSEHAKLRGLL